ncbi:DUF2155 domain-containing protein [Pseudohalocynthiibacter aestuariivivens]|uniref:DUF2155 domain-containing protein n=1 Tax=Roseovarius pelagicus TaxID=2980108 RepID=A0ABY6DA07_9RHOB|nr:MULTISPECIES: DUF2155 domain-containing protein [Rhodobacterales]QIE45086.1 DUF2155 domain-containing protein [Pseudohalocynthiibacter aestuariivivens]UXX82979.1 DUF2155 domain-containing protein [Roseovarius pelagicus]
MKTLAFMAALAVPGMAVAQDVGIGTGAVLRGLEKVSGEIADITLRSGEHATFGRLTIEMSQCRYPQGDPAGDAFAYLTILEADDETPRFAGWMIASSPALNALDHPRYDVWVMRCTTE